MVSAFFKWIAAEWKVEIRIVLVFAGLVSLVMLWPVKQAAPLPPGSASATPKPASGVAATINDIQRALEMAAASRQAPLYVVVPGVKGAALGAIATIAHGLKQPTQPVFTVSNAVKEPTVVPVPSPDASTYAQAYAATVNALHDHPPTVNSNLTITEAPKPIGRIGTIVSMDGAGIDYAVVRRGHFDLDVGVVTNYTTEHLSPVLSLEYMIPKTSVGCGPALGYTSNLRVGVACSVKI